jgi:hypothetical protein
MSNFWTDAWSNIQAFHRHIEDSLPKIGQQIDQGIKVAAADLPQALKLAEEIAVGAQALVSSGLVTSSTMIGGIPIAPVLTGSASILSTLIASPAGQAAAAGAPPADPTAIITSLVNAANSISTLTQSLKTPVNGATAAQVIAAKASAAPAA